MSLGLSGSHRTGKSTLARAYANYEGIPYVATTASAVFKRLGVSPNEVLPIEKRLYVQRQILDEFDHLYAHAPSPFFVADRTPLDLIGYTMVEIGQHSVPARLDTEVAQYVQDCVTVLNRHFGTVALISPGIPIVADDGKASLSVPFIDHLALVIDGAALLRGINSNIFRVQHDVLSLSDRVQSLCSIVDKSISCHKATVESTEQSQGSHILFH